MAVIDCHHPAGLATAWALWLRSWPSLFSEDTSRLNRSAVRLAIILGLVGIVVYFVST